MINRRHFLKSTLATFTAFQFTPFSLAARELEAYLEKFEQSRSANPKRTPILQTAKLNVQDFGTKANGITLDTKSIQAAINKAAGYKTGATVVFPAGKYHTGALKLANNVHLHLEKDAILLGSTNIYDYQSTNGKVHSLLEADECYNIAISGPGTIDGRGRELALNINHLHHTGKRVEADFNYRRNRSRNRPSVIAFHHCESIKLYDINIKNGASWVQHYAGCRDLLIDNMKVESDAFWNNDGIDINDCENVRITGCFVNAADDAICLKSTTGGQFHNNHVYIADCVLRSSSNGIKFGTESMWGFTNVEIENIRVFDTYRSAIALETVDGAKLENVKINQVEAYNVGCAIFIRRGQRNRDVPANTPVGTLKNIEITNVKAHVSFLRADADYEVRGPALNNFFNPIPASITGLPDAHIENIKLENIEISYPGRANKGFAYRPADQPSLVPQERAEYPEYTMFGELPSWGLFVRHVTGLTLKNIKLTVRESDFRPAYVFTDVKQLKLNGSEISSQNEIQIALNAVDNAEFTNIYKQAANTDKIKLTHAAYLISDDSRSLALK
ncbi:glycosyl hydrolase family 28 protein [Catenovulum sp. 2E275]|uniref:glycoside hydrolase family 28 protein n=1 Tax=Catenovulum sp. 2E275 TaxID=2980497 RepID=UPI0021CEA329|nr:glycosyl hydrolase family 28 protein [Catenovulum sp. 2E275]MCU4674124.1 glycosyl hydrolase family 28 protein [Catenovulum sp. 2E275]